MEGASTSTCFAFYFLYLHPKLNAHIWFSLYEMKQQ